MSYLIRRRAVHGLLFVLFIPTGSACTSWKHAELAPVPASDSAPSQTVRVIKRDGSQLMLHAAQLRGDTLHGSLVNVTDGAEVIAIALPMADVADMRVRKFSTGKTVGLVAGSLALASILAVAAAVGAALSGLGGGSGSY